MAIKFSKVELKAFPKLELIERGMNVIGLKDSDYEGLKGHISDIKYGTNMESENESILDIYVNFVEMDNVSIDTTHPHLNGTSISEVICGEDELGFMFNSEDPFFTTADEKAVCPHCFEPLVRVTETQTEDICWNFTDGKYVKEDVSGSSNGKSCDTCNGDLEDTNEVVFVY